MCVICAVQTLALARLSDAVTEPVVGEMVSVPSMLATALTEDPPPEHEPHVGAAEDPESKHWPAVTVPARIANAEASE